MKRFFLSLLLAALSPGAFADNGGSRAEVPTTISTPNTTPISKIKNSCGFTVADEGAWCWFADPRAIRHKSPDGGIDNSYIGYIDIHGNIKAMQYNHKHKKQEEVLVRSWFQPDDHNNPTFLVLPDQRVMIFYSRHTDEPCFYYRVSTRPGDITSLGEEKIIKTKNNTTYPSPFILSDDPDHIYLCWRGINWHPTIARLSMPDKNDDVTVDRGPFQIVQSTGARPYAKYASNGKDRIYLTYTTGHPDNELPNFLYFNIIRIPDLQLEDIAGNRLSSISEGPHKVNKRDEYSSKFPLAIVDAPSERDWVWQTAIDSEGHPVIAMVRISDDKNLHKYYYTKWTGKEWKKTYLCDAGGHFHQTPGLEKCYSGGMAIDPENPGEIYCSTPVDGKYGNVYEIVKFNIDNNGEVTARTPVTFDSRKNNSRPYIIPGSEGSPLRLIWMSGDYYDWIVSSTRPKGYCTSISADFKGYPSGRSKLPAVNKNHEFKKGKNFRLAGKVNPKLAAADGKVLDLGKLSYHIDPATYKPEIHYNGKVHKSQNVLGTSDSWQKHDRGTQGDWYDPIRFRDFNLCLEYADGVLTTYINGIIDQRVRLD